MQHMAGCAHTCKLLGDCPRGHVRRTPRCANVLAHRLPCQPRSAPRALWALGAEREVMLEMLLSPKSIGMSAQEKWEGGERDLLLLHHSEVL